MNAQRLAGMLRFSNERPMLILRDHEEGRIKVFEKVGNEYKWGFTLCPGHLMGHTADVEMLSCPDREGYEYSERCSWGMATLILTELQQTGDYPCAEEIEESDPLGLLKW